METPPSTVASKQPPRPPLYTLLCELVGWTLDRTADIPKNARFTFGQRLDNLALDGLQSVVKAVFAGNPRAKQEYLPQLIGVSPNHENPLS